ncbi:sulfatase [Thalassotalea crassostreae]|uniref:sulfatase n=1 Tax=Thalassotalea crassostreae TaxID=1763536 RepID=UPI0008385B0B|nr:sulfatase [Thalassotalea crassostreae]
MKNLSVKVICAVSIWATSFGLLANDASQTKSVAKTSIQAEQKPNILFIAFDDLRPLIGAYGEPEPITPNIDAFAQDAVRFERSYVSYPLCNPSRASMLTGVRFDLQAENWKDNKHPKLISKQDTWPGVLRDNGYWTATRGKLYHGKVPGNEKKSWDLGGKFWGKIQDGGPKILEKIVDMGGREDQIQIYKDKGAGPGSLMYAAVDGPDEILNDGKVAVDVVDFIKNKRDKSKPFMIASGFARPHMPWVAPKKYFDMYPKDAGKLAYFPQGAKAAFDNAKYKSKTRDHGWNEGVDDNTAQKLIRGYMASTSYADAQMGKVIKALKDEGLYDNTIIIVWGDHGYHLTDHGLWRKNTPFHISLRSPLLIKTPKTIGGTVVDKIVQNIDLYPTLMELTGAKVDSKIKLHGTSLVPLLHANGSDVEWENIAHTSAKGSHGVVTDRYRFTVMADGTRHLYDLEQDPDEWNNLAGDKQYKDLIKDFEQKMSEVVWNKAE